MSKKLTAEEREKLAQELIATDLDFDLSNSTSITYEDLVGNSHTNIGPVFGKTDSPTSAPTVNDVNSEL